MAHMQYDLFCTGSRVKRAIASVCCILGGLLNMDKSWGVLLAAFGFYLATSKYASANRTVQEISQRLKAAGIPFPAAQYLFQKNGMEIIPLTGDHREHTRLPYSEMRHLGEDAKYYYIFRDPSSGFMFPKAALGQEEPEFRKFLEQRTGQAVSRRTAPAVRFARWMRARKTGGWQPAAGKERSHRNDRMF